MHVYLDMIKRMYRGDIIELKEGVYSWLILEDNWLETFRFDRALYPTEVEILEAALSQKELV